MAKTATRREQRLFRREKAEQTKWIIYIKWSADFDAPLYMFISVAFKEALNKSRRAPDGSFSVMLRQSALDVALLRLRALFLA